MPELPLITDWREGETRHDADDDSTTVYFHATIPVGDVPVVAARIEEIVPRGFALTDKNAHLCKMVRTAPGKEQTVLYGGTLLAAFMSQDKDAILFEWFSGDGGTVQEAVSNMHKKKPGELWNMDKPLKSGKGQDARAMAAARAICEKYGYLIERDGSVCVKCYKHNTKPQTTAQTTNRCFLKSVLCP